MIVHHFLQKVCILEVFTLVNYTLGSLELGPSPGAPCCWGESTASWRQHATRRMGRGDWLGAWHQSRACLRRRCPWLAGAVGAEAPLLLPSLSVSGQLGPVAEPRLLVQAPALVLHLVSLITLSGFA